MLSWCNHRLILLVALLLMVFAVAPVSAEMRIFNLHHRPADELAETVRALLGEQAKVAVHRNTLVVRATPGEIAEVASLVDRFDKPMTMLRISVEQGLDSHSSGGNSSASGSFKSGPVNIQAFGKPGPEQSSVFMSTGHAQVNLNAEAESRIESRQASQFISVLDGSPASIRVGRAIPYTSQLRFYSRRHPHFVETVSYQKVDTGFSITPYLHGDVVDAEIAPYMMFPDQDKPHQVVFHEAKTRIRIPLGAWYDLGQYLATHDDLSREILSIGSEAGVESGRVRIRIDPQ